MIENPILPGFNPDPSILRVGGEYWIATSTFEWLPGIQLHRSRDLKHWRLAGHALTRPSQIKLDGVAPSKGVWAPALGREPRGGRFHICYSLVRGITDNFFDLDNFLVTSPTMEGPWSDPVWLNASGFDPSLFHDEDGRAWLVNLEWDFRQGYEHPGAIVLQEYSTAEERLVGEPIRIYRGGSELGCLEGPQLFRRGGFYYLLAAEGGTGYGHGVTLARSTRLEGPWEADPANPILTATEARFEARGDPSYLKPDRFNPGSYLQKAGHGSLVETPEGEAYMVHLCARPARRDAAGAPVLRCVLGRETAIQRMVWTAEGWVRLAAGGSDRLETATAADATAAIASAISATAANASTPALSVDPAACAVPLRPAASNRVTRFVPEPSLPPAPWPPEAIRDDFDAPGLSPQWASPRGHFDPAWLDLEKRGGWLGLRGRQSPFSTYDQSLVAQRVRHLGFRAETRLEFHPRRFQEMAGLICLYDTMNFVYLRMYHSESLGGPALGLLQSDNGRRREFPDCRTGLPERDAPVHLRVEARGLSLRFSWSPDGESWREIGPAFDETRLSDEYCVTGEFTGAFVGLCCQDLGRRSAWAWFDYFDYEGFAEA